MPIDHVRRCRPVLESLESREVPAVVTADLRNGMLCVIGTGSADTITVQPVGNLLRVQGTTIQNGVTTSMTRHYYASWVRAITVASEGGNDGITIGATIAVPTFLYGGWGNDVIFGGSGPDSAWGASGNDVLYGRAGNDMLDGGAGSDYLEGGIGVNSLSQDSQLNPYTLNAVEQAVVNLVNTERRNRNIAELSVNTLLSGAARLHSYNMAIRSNAIGGAAMAHTLLGTAMPTPTTRMDYVGYDQWSAWGENIAYGYATAQAVMNAWMNSPGHQANILSANFTEIGVGTWTNAAGQIFWTQSFGNS